MDEPVVRKVLKRRIHEGDFFIFCAALSAPRNSKSLNSENIINIFTNESYSGGDNRNVLINEFLSLCFNDSKLKNNETKNKSTHYCKESTTKKLL